MKNWKFRVELFFVLAIFLLPRARGLKLLSLDVPAAADIHYPATLRCQYDLEGGNLYSVKWYKDGSEFFRYMPDYDPEIRAVKTSGISVDLDKSDMNKVTITNLQFNNSGNYKCEVSTEAPNFETVADSSNLTVMAYPSEDPMIEGVLSTYSIGDYVSANCTSGKSNPPANLTWYINGDKLGKQAYSRVWEYRPGADETDSQGLHTKTIGLHFQILNSYFSNDGGLSRKMEIRCTSLVGDSARHKSIQPKLVRALTSNKLAQERQANAAGNLDSSVISFVIIFASLHMLCSS